MLGRDPSAARDTRSHPPALYIFLYSAVFLLKLVLETAGALVLVNQDLETVPTGCWDGFSHQTAPFWWLHDPPAFASPLGSSTFGK